jgi:hypothetical protein
MMSVRDMVDELSLRLIDAAKGKFPDKFKWESLNLAQYYTVNMLHPDYLTELVASDSNETVTTGTLDIANLTYKPLRDTEGIIDLKVYNGLYCQMLGLDDIKKEENTYLDGATTYPMAWMFANVIRTLPTTIAALDVDYMKVPLPLMHPFTIIYTGASPGSVSDFLFNDSQNIIETDDYYNGACVYYITGQTYHVITDYEGSSRTASISPDAATTIGDGDTVYFIPTKDHDFHLTNLENVYCTLDASLHEIIIDIAEALCWKVPGDSVRVKEALDNALEQIKSLNASVMQADGIGTK